MPIRSCILILRTNQCVLYPASFVCLGTSANFALKKTQCISCFTRDFGNMLAPLNNVQNSSSKVFGGLNLYQCSKWATLIEKKNKKNIWEQISYAYWSPTVQGCSGLVNLIMKISKKTTTTKSLDQAWSDTR